LNPPAKAVERVIGLDAPPDSFTAAVLRGPTPAAALTEKLFNKVPLGQLEKWARTHLTERDLVVLEASGNSFHIARTLQALAAHAQRQNLERSFAGSRWVDTGLIFTNTLGGPFHFRNLVERYYYPLLESAGLPPIRFHDLRHTAASLMLGPLNIPLMVVSRILGHSRPSITLNVYGHLIPSSHTESARLMDELLSPSELLNLDLP